MALEPGTRLGRYRQRLEREAKTISQLQHPHVSRVLIPSDVESQL